MNTYPQNQFATHAPARLTRREFFRRSTLTLAAGCAAGSAVMDLRAQGAPDRKMRICLSPGSIGVSANQSQAIELAHRHGFEAVEPFTGYLAGLPDQPLQELLAEMKSKGLAWGAAGFPIEFRHDDAKFAGGLKELPKTATALQRAGVNRVGTWLMPCHDSLTYLQNFRQHAQRLREAARILKDHGQRLGVEYVGTLTVRNSRKFPFVHTMAETKELIAEIGTGNVGLVLDSWHWSMAGDTEQELLSLKNEEIVSVDLNDAPPGIPKERQIDGQRELPCATGVIAVATFLNALNRVGYDGPVRAEPFNKTLNDLDNEEACAATAKAMKQAMALVR